MSKKILIVEDDHDTLNLLTDLLQGHGFEVTGLTHTESIIKSIKLCNADLVLLDFLLPGINGGELCHEIKINPATAGLPVIMISGFPRVLESLGNYGSDIFIAKPFGMDELLLAVDHCLNSDLETA